MSKPKKPIKRKNNESNKLQKSEEAPNSSMVRQIGTLKGGSLIWVNGIYYTKTELERNEISEEIPIFAIMHQEYRGVDYKELIIIYNDVAESLIMTNNVQIDEDHSTISAFTNGAEDIFDEAQFHGMRLGIFQQRDGQDFRFDAHYPKYRIRPQKIVQEATEEEIDLFLESSDFTFLRELSQNNLADLIIILPNLYRKLIQFPNFNKDRFIEVLSEVCGGINDEVLASLLNELQEIASLGQDVLGYVTEVHNNRIKIVITEEYDAVNYPNVLIEIDEFTKAVAVIIQVNQDSMEGIVLFGFNQEDLLGNLIRVKKGNPVKLVSWKNFAHTLEPSHSVKSIPISIPLGRIIGSKEGQSRGFTTINGNPDLETAIHDRAQGRIVQIDGEYAITLVPGESVNGIFIGETGGGKSNGIFVFIDGIAWHNRFGKEGNRISLIIFDQHAEYYAQYSKIQNPEYKDIFTCLNVSFKNSAKLRLEDIPLQYFVREQYILDLQRICEILNASMPTIEARRQMHLSTLNEILSDDFRDTENPNESYRMAPASFNAMLRDISKYLGDIEPICLIKKVNLQEYQEIVLQSHEKPLWRTLKEINSSTSGKIAIFNVRGLKREKSFNMYQEIVNGKLNYLREKSFENMNSEQFAKTTPLILTLNEEATNLFATMKSEDIGSYVADATGARKFNKGVVFVFQTLIGLPAKIKLVLSQLGGFNFVFALTMEENRKQALDNVNINQAKHLAHFVENAKKYKYCLTSCEAYNRRPYFVQFYYAREYEEYLLGINQSDAGQDQQEFENKKVSRQVQHNNVEADEIVDDLDFNIDDIED